MAKTGLLVLSNPTRIGGILQSVLKHVEKTLYIQWNPNEKVTEVEPTTWPKHSQTVGRIYYQASVHCQSLDVRVLLSAIKQPGLKITTQRKVDVLLLDKYYNELEVEAFKNCLRNIEPQCPVVTLTASDADIQIPSHASLKSITTKVYDNVVLGGTFDRLHDGHKILLNEALLRATKQLTVGVTDTNMLLSKKLWELIQPCEERIATVNDFLADVDPTVVCNVVPIHDPFGPTKHDPSFQMIVVSSETLSGGKKVNELRCLNGLRTLEIHTIPLIGNGLTFEGEEEKISSSNLRMRILGTRLKTKPTSKLQTFPYIIGLTGGIASGKSSIAQRFEKLGAGLVDCDKLAHELYRPGATCYKLIIDAFGSSIVAENGEVNRKALGAIVFQDPAQLEKLNSLIWPAIADESLVRVDNLYKAGHNIVIVEAAVLLKAGWDHFCHEIWTCIIPPEEAVKRLCERNGLTEDDARSRLQAQPSNSEFVKAAHIAFSTFWSHNFTQKQVESAWNLLQNELGDLVSKTESQ